MKKTLLISCLSIFALCSGNSQATSGGEPLDQIVAVVNDDVVTKSEINHSLAMMKMQMAQQNKSLPAAAALQKKAMDELINKKLQLQMAKQAGINVTDADLDNAVSNIASQNNMTANELYQRINQDGMSTADYRNEMREQMTIQKLQQQEVVGHITVTPEEINSFMHSKIWQSNTDKEYHLEDMLIPVSDTPSTEELTAAKKRAQTMVTKLNHGQSFASLAQEGAGEAPANNDLGWRKLPEIPSIFADHVTTMSANGFSSPIQAPNGFHILHLIEERSVGGKTATPDRQQIQNILMQRKFEEHVQNWVSKIRSQAFITMNTNEVHG